MPRTLAWEGGADGRLVLIDQRRLPAERVDLACEDHLAVVEAIRSLAVRGAPAIGVAAAYGLVLGLRGTQGDAHAALERARGVGADLVAARPTAVNLGWAVRRLLRALAAAVAAGAAIGAVGVRAAALAEARAIEAEDRAMCEAIGRHGAALVPSEARVLTHCNAGALATAGIGTALGVLYTAHAAGKRLRVFARETRPLLQGARITAWELAEAGVDVTLIADAMAGALMRRTGIDLVIVGADRIAANGDVANKIGTYELALLARAHGVPFYVAAPSSTFDLSLASGDAIPIEERSPDEVRGFGAVQTAPRGVAAWNPAFDVTPADLVTAIVTERGVIARPDAESIAKHFEGSGV